MPAPRHRLRLLAVALLLAACTRTPDPGPIKAPVEAPIRLSVGTIEVQDQVQSLPLNFIDRRRTDEMLAATRAYLAQRVQAAGGAEFGRAVVEDGSLIEQATPRGGITGAITGPSRELVGAMAVRVAVVDGLGIEKAYARARVELKRPVREGSSVLERDRVARDLVNDLLRQLDQSLQAAIKENLDTYIAAS